MSESPCSTRFYSAEPQVYDRLERTGRTIAEALAHITDDEMKPRTTEPWRIIQRSLAGLKSSECHAILFGSSLLSTVSETFVRLNVRSDSGPVCQAIATVLSTALQKCREIEIPSGLTGHIMAALKHWPEVAALKGPVHHEMGALQLLLCWVAIKQRDTQELKNEMNELKAVLDAVIVRLHTTASLVLATFVLQSRAAAGLPASQKDGNNDITSTEPAGEAVSVQSAEGSSALAVLPTDRTPQTLRCWATLLLLLDSLKATMDTMLRALSADTTSSKPIAGKAAAVAAGEDVDHHLQRLHCILHYLAEAVLFATTLDQDLTPVETACRLGELGTLEALLMAFPGLVRCINHEQQTLLHRCCLLQPRPSGVLRSPSPSPRYGKSAGSTPRSQSTSPASAATTVEQSPEERRPATHVAVDSAALLTTLLRFPFYVDAIDAAGRTALFYCTEGPAVQLLCQYGADPNVIDERGVTPLHQYVLTENLPCTEAILRCGADPGIAELMRRRNCVHFAAALGHYRLLDVIFRAAEYDVDVNASDTGGNTALHLAAACQAVGSEPLKLILTLLDRDASVTTRNHQGITVLHLVCCNPLLTSSLEPLVEMLLQKGADPNAQDNDGCTPLLVACAYREFGVCKALLTAGGDLNLLCNMDSTFLGIGFVDCESDEDSAKLSHKSRSCDASGTPHGRQGITASDLLPKKPRYAVFSAISCVQSKIRSVHRDRCMNCANYFAGDGPDASFLDSLHLTTGRHHCRHCRRVVCPQCATHCLGAEYVPAFVQEAYSHESSYRVCQICHDVLTDRYNNHLEGSLDWTEVDFDSTSREHYTFGSSSIGAEARGPHIGSASSDLTFSGSGSTSMPGTPSDRRSTNTDKNNNNNGRDGRAATAVGKGNSSGSSGSRRYFPFNVLGFEF